MDTATEALFGKFPRAVGTNTATGQLRQWLVHSEGEFDAFFDHINGSKNAYTAINWRPIGGTLRLDKIPYDFDTPQKENDWPVFGGEVPPQDELFSRMRAEPDVADAVLAPVLDDARKLIRRSAENNIPTICVFSGLGMHVYQLFREKENPDKQLDTTTKKYKRELNLQTADEQVSGDVKRVLRIPNAQRMHLEIQDGEMVGTRPTATYTIPLLPGEVLEKSASELLAMACQPRDMDEQQLAYIAPEKRPTMKTHEDYLRTTGDIEAATQEDMRKLEERVTADDFLAFTLKEHLKLPCMYERIQQPEPDHRIRLNCEVLLLNNGYTANEVVDLFSRLNWSDWDRGITREQVESIYRSGYSDMSCRTLRAEGFCTRADNPTDCPTYEWSGGRAEWM